MLWTRVLILSALGFYASPAQAAYGICMILAMRPGIACSILQTGATTVRFYPPPEICETKIDRDCQMDRDAFFWGHQRELSACRIQSPQGVLYDGRCMDEIPPGILVPDPVPKIVPRVLPPDPRLNFRPSAPSFEELMKWVRAHQDDLGWYVIMLITSALLVYLGANAIAAFFSGGASLATTPATATILVAVILGILRSHGVGRPEWSGPMASIDSDVGGTVTRITVPISEHAEFAMLVRSAEPISIETKSSATPIFSVEHAYRKKEAAEFSLSCHSEDHLSPEITGLNRP